MRSIGWAHDEGGVNLVQEVSKECVDEWRRPRATSQKKSSHQQKRQENREKPPLFVLLEKNPEFAEKSASSLGGLLFEIRRSFLVH